VSGPGTTTFADPASSTTTAAFSAPGTYELELTAEDGELRADDTVTVRVFDPTVEPIRVQVRVQAGSDDAEESASGSVSLSSSDLELVAASSNQAVGVRFARVRVPRGATIVGGYVQFTVDEATTGATSLTIRGQAADHPATFTAAARDINSRPLTGAGVSWSPPQWRTVGWAGRPQRTPDLAPVIQEIVDRPGWSARNAIVLVFTGSGKRVAIAYDGDPAGGPVLRLEYRTEDAQSGLCQSNTRGARTR
jgi:hypothetical protein